MPIPINWCNEPETKVIIYLLGIVTGAIIYAIMDKLIEPLYHSIAHKGTTEDTIVRQSNIYACKQTVKCWKAQWRNK